MERNSEKEIMFETSGQSLGKESSSCKNVLKAGFEEAYKKPSYILGKIEYTSSFTSQK